MKNPSHISNREYDAIVVGGGPAGSTAGAVLAEKGWRTLILEKQKFPRYHVGESLLPYCYFTLKRLGMVEKLNASHFTKKYSVQFVSKNGNASQPFYFFEHFDHPAAVTWQVVRSEFDQMLLDNAREKGADVMEETAARSLIEKSGAVAGVTARSADGTEYAFRAPATIDASGLGTFALKRNDWRVADPELNKVAVWTYYKGAARDEGYDEGATTVAFVEGKGWFWYIPLPNDIVSVGIVSEPGYLYKDGRDPETIFRREIENNSWIREHLEPGEHQGTYYHTGDYSYRSKYCSRDGLVLTGDAFAFLDPVFSSGVFLALRGGEMAADAVDAALRAGDVSAARFDEYGGELCRGIEAMRKLVYAFYDETFSFKDLLDKYPHLHGDLTDCLIGNLYKDFEPLFGAVAEFANIPKPLTHGRAMVA